MLGTASPPEICAVRQQRIKRKNMKRTILACALILCGVTSAFSGEPALRLASASHDQWVAGVLKQIETIKVGMTRQDLLKVFTTEGGQSTRHQQTFVHKECGYIKVDVVFTPVGQGDQKQIALGLPEDQIAAISRPYLARPRMD